MTALAQHMRWEERATPLLVTDGADGKLRVWDAAELLELARGTKAAFAMQAAAPAADGMCRFFLLALSLSVLTHCTPLFSTSRSNSFSPTHSPTHVPLTLLFLRSCVLSLG